MRDAHQWASNKRASNAASNSEGGDIHATGLADAVTGERASVITRDDNAAGQVPQLRGEDVRDTNQLSRAMVNPPQPVLSAPTLLANAAPQVRVAATGGETVSQSAVAVTGLSDGEPVLERQLQSKPAVAAPSASNAVVSLWRVDAEGVVGARKQRWSREAYNRYQREYMRKRRASKTS